jgi:hypothetical protein
MPRIALFLLFLCAFGAFAKDDDQVVFKSDVALTRVDAQVFDRDGRAVTGLQAEDFVLRVGGKVVPIRNFASENMPIDILLLLDVSGSMQPHIERIASAAQQALGVLAEKDRVAIMVFSTGTRVRLPFTSTHSEVTKELNHLLRSEGFNGGTRITRAMLDAASYMEREARPGARRAIVILTDDETQDEENEPKVESALAHANTVLSFLQAPYEPPSMIGPGGGRGRRHGTWGSGGGWPGGGGGGIGFPGGGVGFPGGGGRGPGGYGGMDRSHTAGTATIAGDSGGDTMQVDEASALEDTLARLRQRYALHFYLPEGAQSGDSQSVRVDLSEQAKIRYQSAEVRSRRVFMSGNGGERAGATVVTRTRPSAVDTNTDASSSSSTIQDESPAPKRRRMAVNDSSGPQVNTVSSDGDSSANSGSQAETPAAPSSSAPATKSGGWPKADPQNNKP